MNTYLSARVFFHFILLLSLSAVSFADAPEPQSFQPMNAQQASWVFSGMIQGERGGQYGYFFNVKRFDNHFEAVSALFDAQNNEVLLYDESEADLTDPIGQTWQIGRAFLKFNPINDSWIFGLKKKNAKGFNFKVDMLSSFTKHPEKQVLRPGMKLIVSQTNRLNGHFQLGTDSKEEFVTANNSWFREVWLTEKQEKKHTFSGILCQFDDGSGLYSVSMQENDAQQGAVAGFCDVEGKAKSISQFVNIKKGNKDNNAWHIHVSSPRMRITFVNEIAKEHIQAGFTTEDQQSGFCFNDKVSLGGYRMTDILNLD